MRDLSGLQIGQLHGGGIIFDITEDGHGLILALQDIGKLDDWYDAKRACDLYDGSGYIDWYLPSITELKKLYKVVDKVNSSLVKEGGRAIIEDYYWSSTVFNSDYAWEFDFANGDAYPNANKYDKDYARAIRVF